jgi:salicylate hydroxylase
VEATAKLEAIGGIIVIQANANRILDKLGLYQDLLPICSAEPFPLGIRRYSDGEWLTMISPSECPKEYGYP